MQSKSKKECSQCGKKLSKCNGLIEQKDGEETGRLFCSYRCILDADPLKSNKSGRLKK